MTTLETLFALLYLSTVNHGKCTGHPSHLVASKAPTGLYNHCHHQPPAPSLSPLEHTLPYSLSQRLATTTQLPVLTDSSTAFYCLDEQFLSLCEWWSGFLLLVLKKPGSVAWKCLKGHCPLGALTASWTFAQLSCDAIKSHHFISQKDAELQS